MTKELHCRDLGFDCDAVVTSDSEDEIVAQVAEHGRTVHGVPEEQLNDPAFVQSVRSQIHDLDESR